MSIHVLIQSVQNRTCQVQDVLSNFELKKMCQHVPGSSLPHRHKHLNLCVWL